MGDDELRFDSAGQLLEALTVPDALERRRVLAWVASHPAESIALGAHGGRDIVDVLIALANTDLDYRYWEDVAIAIGAFDAPRVTEFFVRALAAATDPEPAFDAAAQLGRRQRTGLTDRLVEILLSEGPPERAAATAELLVGEKDLPEAAAVRVAALEDDREPPPLTEPAVAAWVRELAGPFAIQARDRLEDQGTEAIRSLAEHWDVLDDEDRTWLLEWATRTGASDAPGLIARALESGPDPLALAALRLAARLGTGAVDEGLLRRWAEHDDRELRAAAVAAGAPGDEEALVSEGTQEPEIIAVAIRRLAEREGAAGADAIAPHLASDSLEVRAAARTAIVKLGPEAIEVLRPLVHSPRPETRAASVRALLDLGDDEWLAQELLDEPNTD